MKVYHYTSLEALKGILSENKDQLCFWGTRYDSMNDSTDCIFAESHIIPCVKSALEEYGYSEDALEDVEAYPYIVSFSQAKDSFFMWRTYKAEIAIELDDAVIKSEVGELKDGKYHSGLYYGKCRYPKDTQDMHQVFVDLFNQAEKTINSLMDTVREQLPLIKYFGFEYEQESRLFQLDYNLSIFHGESGKFIDGEIPNGIGVKCVRDHDFVFYKKFFLPIKALSGIIINCNDEKHFEKIKSHLELFLKMQGITHPIDITQSKTCKYINLNI
ncbi:MAG: hypothetical protein IJX44_05890 [Bacteroidaceae bacterium]|nr:hypothetical protein [Bacteroidaceae bacterium]